MIVKFVIWIKWFDNCVVYWDVVNWVEGGGSREFCFEYVNFEMLLDMEWMC